MQEITNKNIDLNSKYGIKSSDREKKSDKLLDPTIISNFKETQLVILQIMNRNSKK